MTETCPRHDLPLDQPVYKGKRECRACLDELQRRIARQLEKLT